MDKLDWKIYLMVALALTGTIFIGTGITGEVISQSCCFGTECSSEDLCDSAKPLVRPENPSLLYLGALLFVVSGFIFMARRVERF